MISSTAAWHAAQYLTLDMSRDAGNIHQMGAPILDAAIETSPPDSVRSDVPR